MKTELFISWRYLVTRRKEKFISLISIISVSGIAIGVMALIVVIAVMSGFDRDLRDKIVGNYAHITLAGYEGIDSQEYEGIMKKVSLNPHVRGMSPYVQGQCLIKERDILFAANIKGIDPDKETQVTKIKKYIIRGDIDNLDLNGAVIGKELAAYLGIGLGSALTVYSPFAKERTFNLTVSGIFASGMYEYDSNLIFTGIKTAQNILGFGSRISAVSIKLDNLYLADKVKQELLGALGFQYNLKTWIETNANFFAALKLEKLTMFIILALIILVASFNIISTLIVIVVKKTKDIGILKAIGMSPSMVRKIFTYQGLLLGLVGTLLGGAGGISACALLKKYQFIKLPADIYYIDRLPVAIELWPDIILIILAAIVITLISTVYPAHKAARLEPVEALRYE